MSQVTKSLRPCRRCKDIHQMIRIQWHDACGGLGVDHDNHICLECGVFADASGCSVGEESLERYRKQYGYIVSRNGCVDPSLTRKRDVQKISDGVVRYNCDYKTKTQLYDKMLKWFIEQEAFIRDSIVQSDSVMFESPNLLSEIAEEIFEFDAIWVEEE